MAVTLAPQRAPLPLPTLSLRQVAPYALFGSLLSGLLLYFAGVEQGALQVFGGTWVHELVHDGRHLLSFPCH